MEAVAFGHLIRGNGPHKYGSVIIKFSTKGRGKQVRLFGVKVWTQASGIIDICACRNTLLFLTSMDLVNTLSAEHMGWIFQGSRAGCSEAIIREIFVKSGEIDGMLYVDEWFVQKRCKGFWCLGCDSMCNLYVHQQIW